MLKALIIKTSSMGDVIHTLPALTDAKKNYPEIQFDWVVEEAFAEIPSWHPAVTQVIPVALRRWRKNWRQLFKEWRNFYQQLRAKKYDIVIDAQGLIKSAFITRLARGTRCGLDTHSAWEPLATLAYQQKFAVNPDQHAVIRVRQLFAQVLQYPLPDTTADYGIDRQALTKPTAYVNYLVFLHGTTWTTKHWPENYWQALAIKVTAAGFTVLLPWGNAAEQLQAQRIAAVAENSIVLSKKTLTEMAEILASAQAVVAVDTGLGHLAAALAAPTLSLYGPTDPLLTGTQGKAQHHAAANFACAPCLNSQCTYQAAAAVTPACFGSITPDSVWQKLQSVLETKPLC